MSKIKEPSSKFLIYRGRPLVRCGRAAYYGYASDGFIIEFVMEPSEETLKGLEMSGKVCVRLIKTAQDLGDSEILKISERFSMYEALDLGVIWLDRALSRA